MRTKLILVLLLIILVSIGGYFLFRNPTLSKIHNGNTRYHQYIGDELILLVDTNWNVKQIDTEGTDINDFGSIEKGSYNYMFSPTGDYVSYVYEDEVYIKSLKEADVQKTTIPAQTYTWQSDNVITFINISNQRVDSTFYNQGVLSTFDVITKEQKTIGKETIAATSLHPLDDTTGILTIAYGEGGENSTAIASYSLVDGSTELLNTEVALDSTYYSYGYFSYKNSSTSQITYFDNTSQQQEVATPENYTDIYALFDNEYIIAEAQNSNREIVLRDVSEQTEKTLFTINKIGGIQSITYNDNWLIVQTTDALYSGKVGSL